MAPTSSLMAPVASTIKSNSVTATAAAVTALGVDDSPVSYCKKQKIENLEASVDFLVRVRAQLGPQSYQKFLDLVVSCRCRGITGSVLYDRVSKLFGNHEHLLQIFNSFFPGPVFYFPRKRRSYRRKRTKFDYYWPYNRCRRPVETKTKGKSRNELKDFEMEDLLCEVDVNISILESTFEIALNLSGVLSGGGLPAPDVRFDDCFTAVNLALIRRLSGKQTLDYGENPASAITEIIGLLEKERESLKKSRERIVKRWNKSRECRRSR